MIRLAFILSLGFISACSVEEHYNPHDEMILVPGGDFKFGNNQGKDNEKPEIEQYMPSFYLDKHEVTNSEFKEFVERNNYLTDAESRKSSMIYTDKWETQSNVAWNKYTYGEEKLPENFGELPVVHVSWNDARAYCQWKSKRLPTEQELEYTIESFAEGGQNIWEGKYPDKNTMEDGFILTAPVMSYDPNELGIFDLQGNVWEWTQDNYHYNLHNILQVKHSDTSMVWDGASYDPTSGNSQIIQKVLKGGSFLCHASYCAGYRAEAKMAAEVSSSYFHVGFRCACDL